ncbi:hypothetical protein D9613_009205 [Agrocybe pediades]|uniref:Ubiquitin-like domain-containing protein n=1 Tax=Agrocybe pediades TaxID=84607 RepID=A0A8H4R4J7_9AGAR|nr:hypothetical protein D9613_009205 [Agrocybe pediades]
MNQRQQPTQEPEPKLEESNNTINIKVVSAAGEEVFFKIKRSTKLSKLQGAYANKVGKDVGSIRFLYDGERIGDDDTPASLDMDDNGMRLADRTLTEEAVNMVFVPTCIPVNLLASNTF